MRIRFDPFRSGDRPPKGSPSEQPKDGAEQPRPLNERLTLLRTGRLWAGCPALVVAAFAVRFLADRFGAEPIAAEALRNALLYAAGTAACYAAGAWGTVSELRPKPATDPHRRRADGSAGTTRTSRKVPRHNTAAYPATSRLPLWLRRSIFWLFAAAAMAAICSKQIEGLATGALPAGQGIGELVSNLLLVAAAVLPYYLMRRIK